MLLYTNGHNATGIDHKANPNNAHIAGQPLQRVFTDIFRDAYLQGGITGVVKRAATQRNGSRINTGILVPAKQKVTHIMTITMRRVIFIKQNHVGFFRRFLINV